MRTAWLSGAGDRTGTPGPVGFGTTLQSWPVLAGLEVHAPRPRGGLLVIGDSLVDGVGSTPDRDDRLTDQIAARFDPAAGDRGVTVLNAGLSRNRLLQDDPPGAGDAPLTRFDTDVTGVAGVRDVLLLAGTNDLAAGAGPDELIAGIQAFAQRARASGLRVFLTTIPPAAAGEHGTRATAAARDRVNAWLRADGPRYADGVVDAATALADPGDPRRLRPEYDSGDGLHPSAAGYRAVAAVTPVEELSGTPCTE
nr:GDSL-type esterase/lipase family protein [Pseudonocardia sp. C8]